jgi:hypothetical protein
MYCKLRQVKVLEIGKVFFSYIYFAFKLKISVLGVVLVSSVLCSFVVYVSNALILEEELGRFQTASA